MSFENGKKLGYYKDFSEDESSHLIIEFGKETLEDIIYTLHSKLTEQNFIVIKHGKRLYLKGDEKTLLIEAEIMRLKKKSPDKKWRSFSIPDYLNEHSSWIDAFSLLTNSEKIKVCQHILEDNIQVTKSVEIPALGTAYAGQSFVSVLQKKGIIKNIFPLHDQQRLQKLKSNWLKSSLTAGIIPLPGDAIKDYFGENIAYYFCFLDFFTRCLIPLVLLDAFFQIASLPLEFFGVVSNLYFMLAMKLWSIASNNLAFKWGTFLYEEEEKPRSTYEGNEVLINEWSNSRKFLPTPDYRSTRKQLTISWSIITFFLTLLCCVKIAFVEYQRNRSAVVNMVIYSSCLNYICVLYRKLVFTRNELENHYTEQSYEWHLVAKLIALDSVTLFFGPLYSLVIHEDHKLIQEMLFAQLTTAQIINTVIELVIPLINSQWQRVKRSIVEANKDDESPKVLEEVLKTPYSSSYADYLELYLQYGYISIFSALYPKAAMFALFNNIFLESFTDAFKLCSIHQRPLMKSAKGIGVWQNALYLLSAVSLILNVFFFNTYQYIDSQNLNERQWNTILLLGTFSMVALIMSIPDESAELRQDLQRQFQEKNTIFEIYARTKLKEGFLILEKLKPHSTDSMENKKRHDQLNR